MSFYSLISYDDRIILIGCLCKIFYPESAYKFNSLNSKLPEFSLSLYFKKMEVEKTELSELN